MATIFHIALASAWARAQTQGAYTTSTLGQSLADVGFIHASRGDQWPAVRDRFYAGVREPLVLLQIDTDLLDVPVVEEQGGPDTAETFPHIYGPLPAAAVVKAIPLSASPVPPAATTPPAGDASPPPVPAIGQRHGTPADFSKLFFAEMFFNAGLLCLALVCSLAGLTLGRSLDDEWGVAVGGVLGFAVGGWIGLRLYRRRHADDRRATDLH